MTMIWFRILACVKSTNLDYAWDIFDKWSSGSNEDNYDKDDVSVIKNIIKKRYDISNYNTFLVKSDTNTAKSTSATQFYKVLSNKDNSLKINDIVARRSLIVQHFDNFEVYKIKVESYL